MSFIIKIIINKNTHVNSLAYCINIKTNIEG